MNPQDLVAGTMQVSSAPVIYAKLNEAMNSPRASIGYLSTIIGQDAGLSARLLRVVNSAFYGFPSKIDTISRAVIMIGTQQLRDLALATSVMKFFDNVPDNIVTMESFWKHSVTCGLAARALSTYCKESNVERFFVSGILHDIGKLIIYSKLPEKTREIFQAARIHNELIYKTEYKILHFDHGTVGSLLVKAWHLPQHLEEVIQYHHSPMLATRYRYEASIIHIADAIAHAMQIGSSGEQAVPSIANEAWELLDLSTDILPQIFDLIDRQANDVFDRFLAD
jgi:HD-like signal output (HDOD) protein